MANQQREAEKISVKNRYNASFDRAKHEYRPETIRMDSFREDDFQRVAVYARVSTDDASQTTSFELQKRYYEKLVRQHEKWTLVGIFADEGRSGTTTSHRDEFNRMIVMAMSGKIDLIIVKSVSRFARNIVDCLLYVRKLKEKGVGVFFESENVYSLNEEKTMTLEMMAFMAENESQIRRRSQIASTNMRFNNGLPSTPPLYGYIMGENGRLIRDPETWHVVKLIFAMYMIGYSTSLISEKLSKLRICSPNGNDRWQEGVIMDILRSERYCGDVLTWKTFTVDVTSHKTRKNRGERPQSYYREWHDAIVSRDDFIAIQHMIDNAKYKHAHFLPELQVITEGFLKGYVVINPRWRFGAEEYRQASGSVTGEADQDQQIYQARPGEFDLRSFSVVDAALASPYYSPRMTFRVDSIRFNAQCFRRLGAGPYVEMLVHPGKKCLAVRPSAPGNRNAVRWGKLYDGKLQACAVSCKAFADQLMELFGWDEDKRYSLQGNLFGSERESVLIFREEDAGLMLKRVSLTEEMEKKVLNGQGKYILAVPGRLAGSFGRNFYTEQLAYGTHAVPEGTWNLKAKAMPYTPRSSLSVTPYEELVGFVRNQLGGLFVEGEARL